MFNYRIDKKNSKEFLMFDGNLLTNGHLAIKKEYIRITHDKYIQSLVDNNIMFQYNFMTNKKIDTDIKKTHYDINKIYTSTIANNMIKVELCKVICYYNSVLLLLDGKLFSFIDIRYTHMLENSIIMANKNDNTAPIVLCHKMIDRPFAILMPIITKQTANFIDIIKDMI